MWIAADAPDWADQLSAWGQLSGAVATFAAVAFAYWLARRDLRWRREERAVALAEQADRDAAQARLVTGDVKRIDPESDSQVARIIVRNGSTAPVFDVDVTDVRNDVMLDHTWEVVLDRSSAEDDGPLPVWMAVQPVLDRPRVLPAGATFSFTICYMHRATLQPAILYGEDHINIEYTDAVGLRWRRVDNEAPTRVMDGAPAPIEQPRRFRLRLPWTWT